MNAMGEEKYTVPRPPIRSTTGRLSVRINLDTAAAIERLIQHDVNATEVARRAIAVLDVLTTERAKGKEVELVAQDGSRERLRFLY